MMDALSAPRPPVSDSVPAPSTSGRADKADDAGSFSKVLSNSGDQERGAARQRDDDADRADAAQRDAAARNAASDEAGRQSLAIDDALLAELGALPDDVSMGDLVRLLANAKAQGKANQATKDGDEPLVEIEGLDPKLKAELAKALAAVRDKNGAEEPGEATLEQAAGENLAAPGAPPNLADVLQLLAGVDGKTMDKSDQSVDVDKNSKEEQKLGAGLGTLAISEERADDASSGDEGSEGDRDFRFIRADGKGQPLLLRSEGTGGLEQSETKAVETVTIVDSRRYIAPASTSNAASITAAMLGDSDWASAMSPGSELANAATYSSQGKVVHTLKIQMSPIELGSVTATLRLSGEELSVQLTVDNPAALRQLSNDQSDILKALRAQGLVVDQVQVNMQVASSDRSADTGQNGAQSQQSGQQSGQQAFQPGGRDGSERQQRGDATGNAVRMANERVVETTDVPASGNRSARPDQLYV